MITDAIVSTLLGFFNSVISTISVGGSSQSVAGVYSGAESMGNAAMVANDLFPVSLCISFMLAGFAYDFALTGAQLVVWIYGKIPGKLT